MGNPRQRIETVRLGNANPGKDDPGNRQCQVRNCNLDNGNPDNGECRNADREKGVMQVRELEASSQEMIMGMVTILIV